MLRFLCTGDWPPGHVEISWTKSARRHVSEVESTIDLAWAAAMNHPDVHLFDGPMCRLESLRATDDRLELVLSPASYKAFLGTNMTHPEFIDRVGPDVMANAVGLSPALLTADGFLLLGRRNTSVAYYPGRVHPFAGCLEPTDDDPFTAVRRELREELSLTPEDIADLRCTGMAEDLKLRQPELMFAVTSMRSKAEIESQLDRTEHHAIWSIPATEAGVASALADRAELTPIAGASLLLWGRLRFGDRWFGSSVTTL